MSDIRLEPTNPEPIVFILGCWPPIFGSLCGSNFAFLGRASARWRMSKTFYSGLAFWNLPLLFLIEIVLGVLAVPPIVDWVPLVNCLAAD